MAEVTERVTRENMNGSGWHARSTKVRKSHWHVVKELQHYTYAAMGGGYHTISSLTMLCGHGLRVDEAEIENWDYKGVPNVCLACDAVRCAAE
jgi:drug/metabolite transporter superfamily protein YnfA